MKNAPQKKPQNEVLYILGILAGIIPMAVGLIIFFTWWITRAWFAVDLRDFETYGIFWIIISVPVATVGIIFSIIFLFSNSHNHLKKSLRALCLILLNIPVVLWVMHKQNDLAERAYVRINYDGVFDLNDLILKSSQFEKRTGSLQGRDSKVIFYYPRYLNPEDSYPEPEPVKLILIDEAFNRSIELMLPGIYQGQCVDLYIDKEFRLSEKRE